MATLGRRAFILAGALSPLAGLACRPTPTGSVGAGVAAMTPGEFVTLSERLTGRSGLSAAVAKAHLDALVLDTRNGPLLRDLVRGTTGASTPAHVNLEREIIAAWYTSVCIVNDRLHASDVESALMWPAIGRPAPGTCAGATGSWSTAPAPATA